jgi:hypothetical protein
MVAIKRIDSALTFLFLLAVAEVAVPGDGLWHPMELEVKISWTQYLEGVKGMFGRDNFRQAAFGAATALSLRPLDARVSSGLRRRDENWEVRIPSHLGDNLYLGLSVAGTYFVGKLSKTRHLSNTSIYLAEALMTSQAITFIGKTSVGRRRPNSLNARSFPSGHSSAAFTVASVLDKRYGSRIGIPAYALASWIAFSRVRGSKHYPSDVIAGATLGILTGRGFVRNTSEKTFYRWLPVIGQGYRGFGIQFWF